MSIQGGLHRAVERAQALDATALQVFVKSARQWKGRPLGEDEIEAYRMAAASSGLADHALAHASYLLNLASPDDSLWHRSIEALRDEIGRCAALGIPYLVLHPGSHVGAGEERGLTRIARGLERALEGELAGEGRPEVLLEITAGQGSNLGHRFEHLQCILESSAVSRRLGVCLDTCHALAAGYDLRERTGFRKTFREFDRTIGIDRLKAFHLNDSRHPLGSRRDRHEHIGRGEVGVEGFRLILNDRRFRGLPMVLETPKGEDEAEDVNNLARLRDLLPRSRR
jgi:deoxyribonuclease-4